MENSQFKRVVVLMMENQSFDHLLGWLPGVGTLTGSEGQNYTDPGTGKTTWYPVTMESGKNWPDDNILYAPEHDFDDVVTQMYGTSGGTIPVDSAGNPLPPTGEWFLQNAMDEAATTNYNTNDPGVFMKCYTPHQTPVLSALAKNYITCARWFSSLPGPTGPNRLFAHCATSGGYFGAVYNAAPGFCPPMKSIFNLMEGATKSWAIYWDQSFSTARALKQLEPFQNTNFFDLSTFVADAAAGNLADYVFITPSLDGRAAIPPSSTSPGYPAYPPNSLHPNEGTGDTIANGEALIAAVYDAIVSNKELFEETLFLITFDEHGGFYDSIMPKASLPSSMQPTKVNWPDMPANPAEQNFGFMQYGTRVPAIVISAWHDPFVDTETVYEHSAIPATVREVFGIPTPLTNRDAYSPTFTYPSSIRSTPRQGLSITQLQEQMTEILVSRQETK